MAEITRAKANGVFFQLVESLSGKPMLSLRKCDLCKKRRCDSNECWDTLEEYVRRGEYTILGKINISTSMGS